VAERQNTAVVGASTVDPFLPENFEAISELLKLPVAQLKSAK
jgi:hypothetical protein